MIITELTG